MTEAQRQLICKAKDGDEASFQALYHNYYQFVYRYAWKLCRNEADAKDITQEVFLQVYKSISDLRDESLFTPWLRKITHSKCQTIFRKNKDTLYENEQISKQLGTEERKEYIPQDYMRFQSDQEILIAMMTQLSEKKRLVLDQFYLKQMSIHEIAQATGASVNTVKGRLHEGRKALLKMVNEFEKKENRKITFRLDPIPSISLLALLSNQWKRFVQTDFYHLLQGSAMILCAISGGMAIKETYEILHVNEVNVPIAEVKVDEPLIFHPVVYQDRTLTTTNDAYFIIKDFDQEPLEEKTKQELQAIQPVVNELCASDNAYCQALIDSGWLETFQALL